MDIKFNGNEQLITSENICNYEESVQKTIKAFKKNCCCFFGHRKINITQPLIQRLYEVIETLILKSETYIFLFGSNSEFDDLCLKIVTKLQQDYPHIKKIYVRASFPYIDNNYRNYLLREYDDTYYPRRIIDAGKASYVERNYEMIDNSNVCVIYYDETYTPTHTKSNRKKESSYQSKSGTRIAYEYAKRKCIKIKNILE